MNSEERPTTFREHSFLQWLREEFGSDDDGILGIGDDTAWCPSHGENGTLWAMDTVCEGVHMEPGHDLPARLGRKAVLVSLSDIASMGGVPNGALLSIALPKGLGSTDAKDCARAVVATCREYGVRLLGGDTVSTAGPLVVTVALSGHSEGSIVRRAGASDGDLVVVTGALGGSLHDGRHGEFRPRLLEA